VRTRLESGEKPAMDFLESALRSALLKDGAHLLEDLLNDPLYKGQEQEALPGERWYRDRAKTVETLFGEVRLLRDYYVAGDGSSRVPLDESLGLLEGYSPGLAKMMARIAAQDSFEEGSKDLLAYAGVKVGPKAIARMAELVAPQMRAAHAAAKQEQTTAAIPVMYIEGDGTGVPVRKSEARGRKAKNGEGEAKTREVKLGCVFTQTSPDSEGKPQRDHNSTTYVATFQCSEDFGILLRREAFARGFASAQKTVYLGDGAAWVWEVARINFPQAICILDFYHAGEHLSMLAEALYGTDTPRVQSQAKIWRAMLLEDRLQEVLSQAREDLPDIPGPRDAAEKQIAYFETNSSRMTYATFRSQGLFIGSGVVEAGCKTVVGKRLKNSGMFWSVKGAQNVLDLRTFLLSNRFDDLWLARDQKAA
jgi:hypothetical protein